MNKRANSQNFFLYHLYDEVQQKYSLSDSDMDKLVAFIKKFHGDNAGKALSQIRKKKNRHSLEQILQEVAHKELQMDSAKEVKFEVLPPSDGLSFPVGIPLFRDMIVDPLYNGDCKSQGQG